MIVDTYQSGPPEVTLVGLIPSELQLIVAALGEYQKNLEKTLADVAADIHNGKQVVSDGLEDEMFCYAELAKIAQMLFDIKFNHDPSTVERIKEMLA